MKIPPTYTPLEFENPNRSCYPSRIFFKEKKVGGLSSFCGSIQYHFIVTTMQHVRDQISDHFQQMVVNLLFPQVSQVLLVWTYYDVRTVFQSEGGFFTGMICHLRAMDSVLPLVFYQFNIWAVYVF